MPPSSESLKRSVDASPFPYGSYTMPLARRHAQSLQQQNEEPLEESPSASSANHNDKISTTQFGSDNNSTFSPFPLPKGILRICHSKESEAIATTNNCSSHGHVYLRAKGAYDCWACRCGTTTSTTADGGTKTTQWGGPACQKKDVSFQFWLLAGTTIALLAVVGWGVGLLVAMGSEGLPSVIGAGVAGPRAQK